MTTKTIPSTELEKLQSYYLDQLQEEYELCSDEEYPSSLQLNVILAMMHFVQHLTEDKAQELSDEYMS